MSVPVTPTSTSTPAPGNTTTVTDDSTNADNSNSTISAQEGESEAPPNKKIKSGDEGAMEQAPASEWPEAWLMPEGECADQKAPNKLDPNVPVTVEELKALGIS